MPRSNNEIKNAVVAGKSVYLRKPVLQDMKEFLALNSASTQLHRGLVSPPKQPTQFAAFLKRSRRADSACFLICRVEDHRMVGSINLSQIFLGRFRNAYLGYFIGAPYAGRGYMKETIRLMLRYAFTHLKLHRLEANIQPENLASVALVKGAGFIREGYSRRYLKICGRWRDHERWAILAEDWKTNSRSR
ncbi:MAG TPA: GNAT family protein [Pyrinomonadaceae bacterium]|nr:GNAT family protein [Pyrinomonadaceae bacterium]